MSFKIIGTGKALPARLITNEELSQYVETSDEWIADRTGIRERYVVTTESMSDLATQAARNALDMATAEANISIADIDLVIGTTTRHDYQLPSLASLVCENLGAPVVLAYDINAVCTGFVLALDIADTYIKAGKAKNILIVSAEEMSRLIDWTDRNTCVLFGDGAGAVVLTAVGAESESTYLGGVVRGTGSRAPLYALNPRGNSPWSEPTRTDDYTPFVQMQGKDVFKFAVTSVVKDIEDVLNTTGFTPGDVDHFLLHQANKRIIDAAATRFGATPDQVPSNIEHYGNTSSASVPILLDEEVRSGRIQRGDLCIMSAFGAGLLSGACALRW